MLEYLRTVDTKCAKQMLFVLAIVECIKTEPASGQIFTFKIKSHFNLTVTRHFHFQTTDGNVKQLYFVQTESHKRKTSKISSATFCCVSNFDQ
jgi:hypothetical protein